MAFVSVRIYHPGVEKKVMFHFLNYLKGGLIKDRSCSQEVINFINIFRELNFALMRFLFYM